MSNHHNELRNGLYLITKPVPLAGAQPWDVLNVRHDLHNPFLGQRYYDRYDIEAILAADAILPVPLERPLRPPSRQVLRFRQAERRVASGLRVI